MKKEAFGEFIIYILSIDKILNTFIFQAPLENRFIRLTLFIFQIACNFALNSLFYLNTNISDKYYYEGDNLYLFILFSYFNYFNFNILFIRTIFIFFNEFN